MQQLRKALSSGEVWLPASPQRSEQCGWLRLCSVSAGAVTGMFVPIFCEDELNMEKLDC